MIARRLAALALLALTLGGAAACSSDSSPDPSAAPTTAPDPTAGGSTTSEGTPVPPDLGLPPLPELSHVRAEVRGNSARITFDPYAKAKDYRVYLAPQKADVRTNQDGSFASIKNGTYRCAGYRASQQVMIDGDAGPVPIPTWVFTNTIVEKSVAGYPRTLKDATLGYVFQDQAPGTVPVYAVGDPAPYADEYGYGARMVETRSKLYVLDRSSYLAKAWRDDGVAFYAPDSAQSQACGSSAPVRISTTDGGGNSGPAHLYYAENTAESGVRGAGTPAFFACASQASGAQPLMRVYYDAAAGHDELTVGTDRFMRARCQGSHFGACSDAPQSVWEVHWSNINEPVMLIVEALDTGCPFQGLAGAKSLVSTTCGGCDSTPEPLFTIADLRSKAPDGEVFLNGQFDTAATHPIARSAVKVAPSVRPAMDFASKFSSAPETFTETSDCGLNAAFASVGQSYPYGCQTDEHHFTSATYDVLDRGDSVFGIVQGELSTVLGGGSLRVAPKSATATVADDSYLHVALEASSFTTSRRYPQIIVSQQSLLTSQWLLFDSADTNPAIQPVLIMQPFNSGGLKQLQIQLCNQRRWNVNYQCPYYLLERVDGGTSGNFTPHPVLVEHLQTDVSARFDLYLSTRRAYAFFEGQPYGCADLTRLPTTDTDGAAILPALGKPAGNVTVAFGTVLYHPAAEGDVFQMLSPFHISHEFASDIKHIDYFAFKSGESPPAWDETRIPCAKQMHQSSIPGE